MRPSMKTRLEKLEAAASTVATFLVAIPQEGETTEQAVARTTAGVVVDDQTVVVAIRRLSGEPANG
ncbi:MAG: hypothetical protein M0Z99_26825 [Betaproteobacteria bacterium]|nr:hypothetical protein [Betaproteobacteria bacterium]